MAKISNNSGEPSKLAMKAAIAILCSSVNSEKAYARIIDSVFQNKIVRLKEKITSLKKLVVILDDALGGKK